MDNGQKKNTKKVKLAGLDDKHQITAVFAATVAGGFFPPRLIYKGTTRACLSANKFPDSWHVTYTHNHWCNEDTVKLYTEKIIVPFIQKKKDELKLPSSQRALCIMYGFKAQCTREVVKLLDHHGIEIAYVPATCTREPQPLDLSVNKPVKDFISWKIQERYSSQIVSQMGGSDNITPITSFTLKGMKSLGVQWMMGVVNYLLPLLLMDFMQ